MTDVQPYSPDRGLAAKVMRRMTQWRNAAPANIRPAKAILTIAFDDFPKTAASVGAKILDEFGVQGGYYVATGLLGTDTSMGRIAEQQDVRALHANGHEIGAHTHSHIDCAQTPIEEVTKDIERNLSELDPLVSGARIESFAYPFGETTYALKTALAPRFTNLRGVLSGVNRGLCDRAQLRAHDIDGSNHSVDRVLNAIDLAVETPEWIIAFTHDVSDDPSNFGMTAKQLRTILARAKETGTEVLPPAAAARKLGVGA